MSRHNTGQIARGRGRRVRLCVNESNDRNISLIFRGEIRPIFKSFIKDDGEYDQLAIGSTAATMPGIITN